MILGNKMNVRGKNMKVLCAKGSLGPDGATKIACDLMKNMKRQDESIQMDWFLYADQEHSRACDFEDIVHNLHQMKRYKNKIVNYVMRYVQAIKVMHSGQYDVLHVHTDNPRRVDLLICAKIAGIPNRIIHSHNSQSEDESKLQKLKVLLNLDRRLISVFASKKIACSLPAAEWLFGENRINDVLYLKNGIDIEHYRYSEQFRHLIRDELGLRDTDIVLGNVGRFVEQKNQMFLLKLLLALQSTNQNIKLILVGSGERDAELKEFVSFNGLSDKVVFISYTTKINQLYSAMDIFVLPSLFEGLVISAIEAQASGLFCLLSDRISDETRLIERTEFLSIDNTCYWEEAVLRLVDKLESANRFCYADIVKDCGFDIIESAKTLYGAYKEI